ncbi:MAG TPA: cupin domain-containing protein [Bryobacteraceae bacterium]|jgi:quercetin dioxygenase-like cupin family protein|nr:cupin domain-containing protein [Bryobacteraceae bacterium]
MTRRDLTLLSAGLFAAAAKAQKPALATLPSKAYRFEDLTLKGNSRAVFDGMTHTGFHVDLHETQLAPGAAPHAPHRHDHEEVVMVQDGTLEATIEGNVTVVGPGSVIYAASNDLHGWKNVGDTTAHYFVIALGHKT